MPKDDPETFKDIKGDLGEYLEEDASALVKSFIKEFKAWFREWWEDVIAGLADKLEDEGGLMLGRNFNREEKAECKEMAKQVIMATLDVDIRGGMEDILDDLIDKIEG